MSSGYPISLRTSLNASTFDDLLREQALFEQDRPAIDMCWLTFITPTALVQLASLCHILSVSGRRPTLRFWNRQMMHYLLRMQFAEVVQDVADFNPRFRSTDPNRLATWIGGNPVVLEVTRIQQSEDVQGVVGKLVHVLREELGYAAPQAFNVAIAVSEIAQNIYQHNGGSPGFVAMQAYRNKHGRWLEVGVSDAGVGLAATLHRNSAVQAIRTDQDAMRRAIQTGTSEFDDPSRGRGLPLVISMVANQGGTVRLRSGSALGYCGGGQGSEREAPHLAGMHVSLMLPAHPA